MTGDFLLVRCGECGAEQTVFDRVASVVSCNDCEDDLVVPTGGKAQINGEVVQAIQAR